MRCRRARRMIARGAPGEALIRPATELARHLDLCPECSRIARADRWIIAQLVTLRGESGLAFDVRRRVLTEIEWLAPLRRQQVSVAQLALATTAAAAGGVVLAAVLWAWGPTWIAPEGTLAAVVRTAGALLGGAWTVVRALLAIPVKLLVVSLEGAAALPVALGRFESVAIVALALGYLGMSLVVLHYVGRDLVTRDVPPNRED